MARKLERRKRITLESLLDAEVDFKDIKLIRRKVNRESISMIDNIINNVNSKTDLKEDTPIKVLSTLKSLYLIDFKLSEKNGRIHIDKWFEVDRDPGEEIEK